MMGHAAGNRLGKVSGNVPRTATAAGPGAGQGLGKPVCLHLRVEVIPVISIAMLSGGEQAAAYYLDRDADCGARYYTDTRLDAGYWCGQGAAALGLTGPV